MNATLPNISEDIWGDEEEVTESYYTVYVYRTSGLGNEATFTNVLATDPENATARVAGSNPWYKQYPMVAYVQKSRVF